MAVAVYVSDLTDLLLDMPATTGWTALGGGASGLVAPETDFFIQGSNCISKAGWGTATKGMIYNTGAGVTVASGKAVYMWQYFWAPNSLDTEANGGLQLLIGSSAAAFKQWYIRGSNTLVYGGWVCAVVDPTVTANTTTGSPTATLQYFGCQAAVPAGGPSKGQPLGIDAFRHGRDYTVTLGDGTAYGTFAGAATYNDDISRRYGQFQAIDGGYLMQCRFLFGSSGTAVDFRDSNRVILIARTTQVTSSFNRFEVVNASSNVALTNISISALGTVSRGDWVTTDNATVALTTCVFSDMGTFGFASNTTAITSTFRRCNLITQNSATLTGCTFDSTNDATKALLSNNLALISSCKFVSSGTKYAIETSVRGTYNFSANTFTGYGATGTANAAIFNNITPTTSSSYAETNQSGTNSLRTGSTIGTGQSFTNTSSGVLSACRFYLKKTGAPTGNAVAKVYAHSGTLGTSSIPTGTALATSDNFDVSTLTTSYALASLTFTGANNITLAASTNYVVTIEYSGGSVGNTLDVGTDTTTPTATGNSSTFTPSTWTAVAGTDLCFYVYTGGDLTLNITNGGGTPTYNNTLGCSTTVNNAVTLTVTVKDSTGTAIQNVRVAIYKSSNNTEISNSLTNVSGVVTSSYVYLADTTIYIRARKTSTGTTRYINNDSSGTITSGGFSSTITLLTDTIASP